MDRLSFREYELLLRAHSLKQADTDYRVHQLAWLSTLAKAEKSAGKYKTKPVYDRFEKFYNYEEAVAKAKNPKKEENRCRFKSYDRYLKERRRK